jgi:hypothetical protein
MLALYFILITILTIIIIGLGVQFFNIIFRGHAPFISTKTNVINKIFSGLDLPKNFSGQVYELGSGKASFLKNFQNNYPEAKLTGVEYSFWPYLISKIQLSLNPKSKIQIIKKNMFSVDLKNADVIYCFLNIEMMKDLEKKFKAECKPGATIISYCFHLPNIQPVKEIEAENKSKIFYYKI